ncbi:hypothetical protein [Flavobacterium sp.]|uniref:hypothetical protein n=1 Tax=Flavobacterium sp. TaxID=239 RepID=UPI003B9D7CAF
MQKIFRYFYVMGSMTPKSAYLLLFLLLQTLMYGQKTVLIKVNFPDKKIERTLKIPAKVSDEDRLQQFTDSLRQSGYLFASCKSSIIEKNSILFECESGTKFNTVQIDLSSITPYLKEQAESILMKPAELPAFMESITAKLQDQGMALAGLKTVVTEERADQVFLKVEISNTTVRKISNLIFAENTEIPKNVLKHLKARYRRSIFNDKTISKIEAEINNLKFARIARKSEVLFTKDSTLLYIYDEKVRNNRFEGFAGLQNADNKLVVNGYLDLALVNILKSSEEFQLNWKTDGQEQRNFFFSGTLPYLFNSNLVLRGQLNIFRQDSTFQTSKSAIEIGYLLKHNSRIFLGYESGESSDIQSQNSETLQDFRSTFYTVGFDFSRNAESDDYFRYTDFVNLKLGLGKSVRETNEVDQTLLRLTGSYNIAFSAKSRVQINTDNYFLGSQKILVNELYRFGGFNSIRGLNENVLQAHSFTSLMNNYYYLVAPNLNVQILSDFGFFSDQTTNISKTVFAAGAGFVLATKNGFLNFTYAFSRLSGTENSFRNALAHISFKSYF